MHSWSPNLSLRTNILCHPVIQLPLWVLLCEPEEGYFFGPLNTNFWSHKVKHEIDCFCYSVLSFFERIKGKEYVSCEYSIDLANPFITFCSLDSEDLFLDTESYCSFDHDMYLIICCFIIFLVLSSLKY